MIEPLLALLFRDYVLQARNLRLNTAMVANGFLTVNCGRENGLREIPTTNDTSSITISFTGDADAQGISSDECHSLAGFTNVLPTGALRLFLEEMRLDAFRVVIPTVGSTAAGSGKPLSSVDNHSTIALE